MDALEMSERVIAKVLTLSLHHGISDWLLGFEDLGLSEEYAVHFFPCVRWLEAEGLLRATEHARTLGGPANGAVVNPVLTSRGFAVLGAQMDVGDGKVELSESVKNVSEGNASYAKAGNFTGGLLAAFIKSLG